MWAIVRVGIFIVFCGDQIRDKDGSMKRHRLIDRETDGRKHRQTGIQRDIQRDRQWIPQSQGRGCRGRGRGNNREGM